MEAPGSPPPDLDGRLKRLHLPTVRRLYPELALRAEGEGMTDQTFLELLIAEGIAHRADTRLRRAVAKAQFPYLRTIDDSKVTFQSALRRQMLGTYLGLELVTEGRHAIFRGPSGTGNTYLAVAIAYRALQHGYEARFVSADLLIGELSHAVALGTLDAAIAPYLHPQVPVLYVIGYLSHAADAANVLCRLMNDRYLPGRPLAAWGQVLHDGDLAEAILARPLERGVHYGWRGHSCRTWHLKDCPTDPPEGWLIGWGVTELRERTSWLLYPDHRYFVLQFLSDRQGQFGLQFERAASSIFDEIESIARPPKVLGLHTFGTAIRFSYSNPETPRLDIANVH